VLTQVLQEVKVANEGGSEAAGTPLTEFLRDAIILTHHTGQQRTYAAHGFSELTVADPWLTDGRRSAKYGTFAEYFNRQYNIADLDPELAMVAAQPKSVRSKPLSHLLPPSHPLRQSQELRCTRADQLAATHVVRGRMGRQSKRRQEDLLPQELCVVHGISWSLWHAAQLLPSMFFRLEVLPPVCWTAVACSAR
jgi:PAZ domain